MSLEEQLYDAATVGDLKRVKSLLQRGANVSDGVALLGAALEGHLEVVKLIASAGVDMHVWGDFILREATKSGHLKLVEYLVESYPSIYSHMDAALRIASSRGYLDIVKFLISKGADIHSNNGAALSNAAEYGHIRTVKLLVESGADIHAKKSYALRMASHNGHLDVVKYLVESGADVHALNNAALLNAAHMGHLEVVKYLVENGADIHAGDDYVILWAASNKYTDIVELLIAKGADINALKDDLLRWSAGGGDLEKVKSLLSEGADIHANNDAALHDAAENGHIEVVKYLMLHGADILTLSDKQLLLTLGLSREELEEVSFKRTRKYNISNTKEVYKTLPNELLYKIRSFMQVKGLDTLDIKNVYNSKHPLHKFFGEYIEDKPFIIKNFVFNISDLDTILDPISDKYNLSYTTYDKRSQQHLGKDNLVIQLNFKEEYLEKIFEIQGSEFKDFYENISKLSIRSGHPVLPFPGRTYGWARIYVLEEGWLINEIQTDWKHLISFCKQLSTLKPGEEFQGHRIDERISEFFQTAEQREWGKFIGETMLENFDELIMSSILNVARRNSVHHIYMLTPKNQPAKDSLAKSMLKDLYHSTPRKFKFHKVVTDLGAGDQEYWYRTARKV